MTASALISLYTVLFAAALPATRRFFFLEPSTSPRDHSHPTSRLPQIDAVRALAIVAVMGIHAFYLACTSPGLATPEWAPAALLNNMLRFAVPVFLFFSGYCLSPWPSTPPEKAGFYLRKLRRIFVPYALLTAILSLYSSGDLSVTSAGSSLSAGSSGGGFLLSLYASRESLSTVVRALFAGSGSVPFYFIVVLAQMYVLYPALYRIARLPRPAPAILLGTSLAVSLVSAEIPQLRKVGEFHLFLPYLFTFVFGLMSPPVLQSRKCLSSMLKMLASYTVLNGVAAVYLLCAGPAASEFADGWYTYNFQYFYAVAVAVLAVNFFARHPALCRFLAPMGKFSLWIFLLHYPVQEWAWRVMGCRSSLQAFWAAAGLWAATTLAAWACSAIPSALASSRAVFGRTAPP